MKPISVTRADFKETAQSNYYIDKTNMISEILNTNEKAILFCRPRRFGKTLNMSMLYYFFSNQEESQTLFNDLNVSKDKTTMQHLNEYPTIFLSLKDLGNNLEEFNEFLKDKLVDLTKNFSKEISLDTSLVDLISLKEDAYQKHSMKIFSKILNKLINCLHEYFNEQVVI